MLHHPGMDPVAIEIGPLAVHWYGLMYLAGFVTAWWLGRVRARRPGAPLTADNLEDLIFYGALGVILGGRLGYVLFYGLDQFLANPLWLFRIDQGGMSFHGGMLGVIAAMLWFSHRIGRSFGELLDFVAPLVPPGLGFGRLGNFIGQELWGRPSSVPWAMVFPNDPQQLARHPSQLYQAFLEGLVLFCVLWWFSSRPRPRWAVGGLFILLYGVFRILAEFVREPDHGEFFAQGWITRGQVLSLPMVIGGIALMLWAYSRQRTGEAGART